MRWKWVVSILVACLFLPVPSVDSQTARTDAPWWGPTGPGEGHHVRIPVTVVNPYTHAMPDLAVRLEVDVAKALSEAGWVHAAIGGRPVLRGFEFDPDSARVIRVSDHGTAGRILAHDSSRGAAGAVVPSAFVEGLVSTGHREFDPTNPLLTFYWKTGPMQASQTNYYYLYLDSTTNVDHPPLRMTGRDVAALDSLHWAGPVTTAYGSLAPTRGNQDTPTVTLIGLQAGTSVDVQIRGTSGYQSHQDSPFTLQYGRVREVALGTGADGVDFRLRSTTPFLARVEDFGFVPALSGGFTGRSFIVSVPAIGHAPSVTFLAPHDRPVTVTATGIGAISTDSRQWNLNGNGNPLPYTIGAYDNDDPNAWCSPGSTALQANQAYLVEATDDIQVLIGERMNMQQIPAAEGGPQGTTFASILYEEWGEMRPFRGQMTCFRFDADKAWMVMDHTANTARATNPERQPAQIDPTPTSAEPNRAHAVPGFPGYGGPFTREGGVQDRPLFFHTTDSAIAFAGTTRNAQSQIAGAFGGLNVARNFLGVGPAAIIALHDDTIVNIEGRRVLSGPYADEAHLAQGQAFRILDGDGSDIADSFKVEANRPVVVYGLRDRPVYLAGVPAMATATMGSAEFRGFLLSLEPLSGREPARASTLPGTAVTYQFVLENLGRGANGQGIDDFVQLRLGPIPKGWTAEIDRTNIPLPAGATTTVEVQVVPPADVASGTSEVIALIATSQGNPNVAVSSSTVTYIQRSYDVGLWIDVPDGPKSQTHSVGPNTEDSFSLVVRNTGTVADSFQFTVAGLQPGWDARLLQGEDDTDQVNLAAGASAPLRLQITPPPEAVDAILALTITATSLSSPAAFDRVNTLTRIRAPAEIVAVAPNLTRLTLPGDEARFPIHIENRGQGSIGLDFETSTDVLPGWSASRIRLVNHITGELVNMRVPLQVAPGDRLQLVLSTEVAEQALAGDLGTLRIVGRPPGGKAAFEFAFTVVTAPDHRLVTRDPGTTQAPTDGDSFEVTFQVENVGNLVETVFVREAAAPPNWTLVLPAAPFKFDRGENQTIRFVTAAPMGVADGNYEVQVSLISGDGHETPVAIPVTVSPTVDVRVVASRDIVAQPGHPALMDILITNVGNRDGTVKLRQGGDWSLAPYADVHLSPGESRQIMAGWIVPTAAHKGEHQQSLELILEPRSGDVSARAMLEASIEVDLPQLRVVSAEARSGPGGQLVVVTLENIGARDAIRVDVQLLHGDDVVDSIPIDLLPSGDEAKVALVAESHHSPLRVRAIMGGSAGEAIHADGEVISAPLGKSSPGPLGIWAFLALAAAFRRRLRPSS